MDKIKQTSNLQKPQPIKKIKPVQKGKNIFKYLFFVSLDLFLIIIITGYFLLNKKTNNLQQSTSIPIETQTDTTSTESKESTTDSNEWSLYTNHKYGFTLKIPKEIRLMTIEENCKIIESNPVVSFEGQNVVYFAPKYFGCQNKKITTLSSILKGYPDGPYEIRKVYFTKVNNQNEINQFIKSIFGSSCKLGEKTKSSKNNVFNISISAEPNSLDESDPKFVPNCYIGMTNSFYNSTNGSLVIFYLGTEAVFMHPNESGYYDYDMADSLEFF
jgi:hypothetical protein